jgi:hypothetical protein
MEKNVQNSLCRELAEKNSLCSFDRKLLITILILILFVIIIGCGSNSGNATLTWSEPSTNQDGTTLTDLGGYNVYYGTSSGSYTDSVDVGNASGVVINALAIGRWCFAVTAYDNAGNESNYSTEVCKDI